MKNMFQDDTLRYEKTLFFYTLNRSSDKLPQDYCYKSKILNEGIDKVAVSIRRFSNNLLFNIQNEKDIIEYKKRVGDVLESIYSKYSIFDIIEGYRIYDSNRKRVKRLKNKIEYLTSLGQCLFLTLTFTDYVFSITNEYTRRQYIYRFLKSYSDYYVANIDFGSRKGREHYHAIIRTNKINHTDWKYGAINFKKIYNDSTSDELLSKYITKLTNHSIKKTTKRKSLVYSKKLCTLAYEYDLLTKISNNYIFKSKKDIKYIKENFTFLYHKDFNDVFSRYKPQFYTDSASLLRDIEKRLEEKKKGK